MTTSAASIECHVPHAARHPEPRDPRLNGFGPSPAPGSWPNRPRLVAGRLPQSEPSLRPEPGPWSGALARAAVEVVTGGRPAVQLLRWLDPPVYERLAARAGLQSRIRGNRTQRTTTVRAVRICPIDERHIEATAAVWDGTRVRAVAMRLEARRARWLAIELLVG